ncbi:cupin domain-containing protein [Burkholderia gladioli]|uniref:cupin domain-containing protein n=1 Tax=Burkholderia gladioli TaxID=28095 RepID=UPI00264A7EA4|nr:cupin domain-containing protein [Burkholderia gladioli]MDN7754833.1 cupin domain-containing protein [Burkholderia gladioli]
MLSAFTSRPHLNALLFGDLDLKEFFDKYFEKSPLHLPRASVLYVDFNLNSFENYLALLDGHLDEIVFVSKEGNNLPLPPAGHNGQSQLKFLREVAVAGATLRVGDLERRDPLIATLCRELEIFLFGSSVAKLFFTAKGNHGFSTHYDGESVFVIQLSGQKKWTVYPNACKYATRQMATTIDPGSLPPPLLEVTLEPGDVLYLPAGVPHHAESQDNDSLHLSVGITPWNAADVINYVVAGLTRSTEVLRQPLRGQYDMDSEVLKDALELVLGELHRINSPSFINDFRRAVHGSRPSRRFSQLHNIDSVKRTGARLRVRRNRVKHVEMDVVGGYVNLYLGSSTSGTGIHVGAPGMIRLPLLAKSEVEFLIESYDYHYADETPGMLDVDSKLALTRRLIEYEILEAE